MKVARMVAKIDSSRENGTLPFSAASVCFFAVGASVLLSLSSSAKSRPSVKETGRSECMPPKGSGFGMTTCTQTKSCSASRKPGFLRHAIERGLSMKGNRLLQGDQQPPFGRPDLSTVSED
ncbi:hypothetical protein RHECNPAF_1760020 [Rhizobium etli CNPAF512]|nr:hypothetical protein RHECNPAF_1760020 [Rhizobium etli CNPAF512]